MEKVIFSFDLVPYRWDVRLFDTDHVPEVVDHDVLEAAVASQLELSGADPCDNRVERLGSMC